MAVCVTMAAAFALFHQNDSPRSVCFADAKKCACPVTPDEKVLIPCGSVVDPGSCGVCSVITASGKRDGRSCITVK